MCKTHIIEGKTEGKGEISELGLEFIYVIFQVKIYNSKNSM